MTTSNPATAGLSAPVAELPIAEGQPSVMGLPSAEAMAQLANALFNTLPGRPSVPGLAADAQAAPPSSALPVAPPLAPEGEFASQPVAPYVSPTSGFSPPTTRNCVRPRLRCPVSAGCRHRARPQRRRMSRYPISSTRLSLACRGLSWAWDRLRRLGSNPGPCPPHRPHHRPSPNQPSRICVVFPPRREGRRQSHRQQRRASRQSFHSASTRSWCLPPRR